MTTDRPPGPSVAPPHPSEAPGEPVLRLDEVTRRFGARVAVDRLSLEVHRGELFGLLGPNGAGKTTTFGLILGLVRPTSGRLEVLGLPAADVVRVHRRVGAMIEHPAFHPSLSARANLAQLARLHGRGARARIAPLLAKVGLSGRAADRVATFSQGMKQRLALAAALLHDPELLLLDEPTNGLDPEGSDEIWTLLRALARDEGKTVIVSSHLLHEIEATCDRVAVLRRGRLVACEPVERLLRAGTGAGSRVRIAYLDAAAAARACALLIAHGVALDPDGGAGARGAGGLEPGRDLAPGGAEFEVTPAADAPRGAGHLVALLAAAGLAPDAVAPVRPTLKELFLRLTGAPGGDDDAGAE